MVRKTQIAFNWHLVRFPSDSFSQRTISPHSGTGLAAKQCLVTLGIEPCPYSQRRFQDCCIGSFSGRFPNGANWSSGDGNTPFWTQGGVCMRRCPTVITPPPPKQDSVHTRAERGIGVLDISGAAPGCQTGTVFRTFA